MKRFEQRKNSMLKKGDKSSKGGWDSKIIKLCNKINKKDNYYTTSSCSGRVILMKDVNKKKRNLFLKISHDLIKEGFFKDLKLSKKGDVKFKFEPFIIHIACLDLEDAEKLIRVGLKVGFKQVGIISLGKNIIVEIKGSEKIEFPFSKNGKVLVGGEFLKEVVKKSRLYFKRGWDRVSGLEKEFK